MLFFQVIYHAITAHSNPTTTHPWHPSFMLQKWTQMNTYLLSWKPKDIMLPKLTNWSQIKVITNIHGFISNKCVLKKIVLTSIIMPLQIVTLQSYWTNSTASKWWIAVIIWKVQALQPGTWGPLPSKVCISALTCFHYLTRHTVC